MDAPEQLPSEKARREHKPEFGLTRHGLNVLSGGGGTAGALCKLREKLFALVCKHGGRLLPHEFGTAAMVKSQGVFGPLSPRKRKYSSQRSHHVLRVEAGVLALNLLTACSTLGPIEERAQSINVTTADYQAAATLYNIMRASQAEPLNFVSLTGVTGHNTFTAGIGLPTIIVGPGRTSAQNLFLFGPNTVGASVANDFVVNVVDDPQSIAALSQPSDVATLGFLINQQYDLDEVLFLFVSKVELTDTNDHVLYSDQPLPDPSRSLDSDSNVAAQKAGTDECISGSFIQPAVTESPVPSGFGRQYCTFENEPLAFDPASGAYIHNDEWEFGFRPLLNRYIDAGLTVVVDPAYVPQPGKSGNGSFCFGRPDPDVFPKGVPLRPDKACRPALRFPPTGTESDDEATHLVSGSVVQTSTQRNSKQFALKATVKQPKPFTKSDEKHWEFEDPFRKGVIVHVYTRSVYGAYRFLGEVERVYGLGGVAQAPPNIGKADLFSGSVAARMLSLTNDLLRCWVSIDFEGTRACVPAEAVRTKRTFQILHTLFGLYARPNTTPATQTVRTTP